MKLSNTSTTAVAVFALTASGALASDLTVTSWGGGYTASQQKAYGEPWEAKTATAVVKVFDSFIYTLLFSPRTEDFHASE